MVFLPATSDFRQSAVSASWIHKMIRDADNPNDNDNGHYNDHDISTSIGSGDVNYMSSVIAACKENPSLLWECTSRQWTAMHVAASNHDVIYWKELLELSLSSLSDSSSLSLSLSKGTNNHNKELCQLETDMGYTCLDLFFRRALYPFPWQSNRQQIKRRAEQLRCSIHQVCSDHHDIAILKEHIIKMNQDFSLQNYCDHQLEQQQQQHSRMRTRTRTRTILDTSDPTPIQVVLQFWKNLEILLCAIHFGRTTITKTTCTTTTTATTESSVSFQKQQHQQQQHIQDSHDHDQDNHYQENKYVLPVLQILANLHWCPEPVAMLAIRLFPEQLHIQPSSPSLSLLSEWSSPLHIWASIETTTSMMVEVHAYNHNNNSNNDNNTITLDEDVGMLKQLCHADPQAAAQIVDSKSQRLPLQTALMVGKQWPEIQPLLEAYPNALNHIDYLTKLPTFCLAAISSMMEEEDENDKDDDNDYNYNDGNTTDRQTTKNMTTLMTTATKTTKKKPKKQITNNNNIHNDKYNYIHSQFHRHAEKIAKQCDPQRLSVWCYISQKEKQRAIQQAQDFLHCQQLSTIYELLCHNPSALTMMLTTMNNSSSNGTTITKTRS